MVCNKLYVTQDHFESYVISENIFRTINSQKYFDKFIYDIVIFAVRAVPVSLHHSMKSMW